MTKFVKGGIPKNFITDKDILITSANHSGETLEDIFDGVEDTLDKHQDEIDKLKSNLKYVYSYGGVGGRGSGSGGGGSQTEDAVLVVKLNGQKLQNNGNPIVLNGVGIYTVEVSVSRINGRTFKVKLDTLDAFNEYTPTETISPERKKFTKNLSLINNGTIRVEFYNYSDGDGELLEQIDQRFIVKPHTFDVKFKYEFIGSSGKVQEGEFLQNEYFIGDSTFTNPFIDISYTINLTDVTNVSVEYTIGDTDEVEVETDEHKSGHKIVDYGSTTDISTPGNHLKIYIDKLTRNDIKFTTESNTGVYTVTATLKYSYNQESVPPVTVPIQITIIPNHLYINVRNPENLLYDSIEELLSDTVNDVPRKNLTIGSYTGFYCKIFEKELGSTPQKYNLSFEAYNLIEEQSTGGEYVFDREHPAIEPITRDGVDEQVETITPISAVFNTTGIKQLIFSAKGRKPGPDYDVKKETIKYIYVKEMDASSIIDWYPDVDQSNFYFRANTAKPYSENFLPEEQQRLLGNTPWELNETKSKLTIQNDAWVNNISSDRDTTILSIGIQYSSVNKEGATIFELYDDQSNIPNVTLYSNQFFTKKIFIPTSSKFNAAISENYHLVQIVRQRINRDDSNNRQYATYLYIDGVLESNSPTLLGNNGRLKINKIVFNNVNAIYNLVNIQYVNLNTPSESKGNYKEIKDTHTIDELIYRYYLAYKSNMHIGTVSETERNLLTNIQNIKFDGENTIVNSSFVQTVSPSMPIPTMMMEFGDEETTQETYDIFVENLFAGYRDGAGNPFSGNPPIITLHWCDGLKNGVPSDFKKLSSPTITDKDTGEKYIGDWKFKLQGTSTMKNKIKNFSLVVFTRPSQGGKHILISPNYDPKNPNSFLPEDEWTLKADIADSAHANNTSIGRFVNRACTKFVNSIPVNEVTGTNFSEEVKPFIKNTLEGFPVLLYFKVGEAVYYFGVYNFNMGRTSYYNLGYHTQNDIQDMIEHIEPFGDSFSVSLGEETVISTLGIGEIQENNPEFDFHQYDRSVLFSASENSTVSTMFGPSSKRTGYSAENTLEAFVKSVAKAGAYCFNRIGKRALSSRGESAANPCENRYTIQEDGIDEYGRTKYVECVPDLTYQFHYVDTNKVWDEIKDPEWRFDRIGENPENLLQCISDTNIDGIEVDDNQDGINDYHYLDYTSASEYYTICMAFGLVDSIVKNMNIKSWDAKKCYIAFYDMDCALGENNVGKEVISYLAATDYWHSPIDNGQVSQVKIYYDYWNNDIGIGYDYTSSYLFAIVKYAQSILSKMDGVKPTLVHYPQEFWAVLRKKGGLLENANVFIRDYFSSGIGQIPALMASLNYQVKYMYNGVVMDDTNTTGKVDFLANQAAFNGTRIEKVRDWLDKRLHFMDVVFNVQRLAMNIGRDISTPVISDDLYSGLSKNPDVTILLDAFSTDSQRNALRQNINIPVGIYAPTNTPCIINKGQNGFEMYILGAGVGNKNTITINSVPAQACRILGSKEFTDLDRAEPFFTNAYRVESNKLERIIYSGLSIPADDTTFNVISTSVKIIQLNISTLSGELKIDNGETTGEQYGQSLQELNISTSGFRGKWTNLKNLRTIDISSVNNDDQNGIEVSGCPLLSNCIISGKNSNELTTLRRLTMTGVSGNFNLTNTKIETINISASENNSLEFSIVDDKRLENITLTGFKSVIIRGCPNLKSININEGDINKCEKIIIEMPSESDITPKLKSFNSEREGVFDFTKYGNLETLGLSGSLAEVIKIPNKKVSVETFKDNKNLEFVDTTGLNSVIEILKDSTFYNCPRYGMMQSWTSEPATHNGKNIMKDITEDPDNGIDKDVVYECKKMTKMCISPSCESLAFTFDKLDSSINTNYPKNNPYTNEWGQKVYNNAITIKLASTFINDIVGGNNFDDAWLEVVDSETITIRDGQPIGQPIGQNCKSNIKSLQCCFNRQGGIVYTTLRNNGPTPNLSEYTSLTNIMAMYNGTGVKLLSKELLSLPDSCNTNDDENELLWSEFIGSGDINITKDAFKHISYRITEFSSLRLSVYDSSKYSSLLETSLDNMLDVVDILCPKEHPESPGKYIPFTRIKGFTSFSINSDQWVDYSRLFELCPEVVYLNGFLNTNLSRAKIDGMLKSCTKLNSIVNSINHTGDVESDLPEVDLYDFFNWEDSSLYGMSNLFSSESSTTPGFCINKKISNEHFFGIINSLHNYYNIVRLSNIFSYCKIDGYVGGEIVLQGDMNKITNINALFYKCHGRRDSSIPWKITNDVPLKINRSFFKHLPNVTSMANTFYDVHFDHMLTYDFFCKRIDKTSTVGVNVNGVIKYEATLTTIGYSNPINDMYNCFTNAKFVNCKSWFDEEDGNKQLRPRTDMVTYNGNNYTTYYTKEDGVDVEHTIKDPVAYTDTLNNFTNYVPTVSILTKTWHFINHNLSSDLALYGNSNYGGYPFDKSMIDTPNSAPDISPTYCCLPPDILHACNYDCILTDVFANTNIIGVLPQHLMKNCYSSTKINNMFQNVNILPNVVYHYNKKTTSDSNYLTMISGIGIDNDLIKTPTSPSDMDDYILDGDLNNPNDATVLFRNSDGELKRRNPIKGNEYSKSQFVYVPQGYTINENLQEAFTFRYNLPKQVDLYSSTLANEGIKWDAGGYSKDYSPDVKPDLWPYHIQYFFILDESVDWRRVKNMSYPFISDNQDVDYTSGLVRVFSTNNSDYKNTWWSNFENVNRETWDSQTSGLLNVFLDLCGKRDVRTGKIKDNGCQISNSMSNFPQLTSFVSGNLVTFLNGKIFDDIDAMRFGTYNTTSQIILYTNGLARNIIFPQMATLPSSIKDIPKVVLMFTSEMAYFYDYMFTDSGTMENYKTVYNISQSIIKTPDSGPINAYKYRVL